MKGKRRKKIGLRLLAGMLLFATAIFVLTTLGTSLWMWGESSAQTTEYAYSYAKTTAQLLDGDKIKDYYQTHQKDDYYEQANSFLIHGFNNQSIKYLYVFVPEENNIVYIWDGLDPTGVLAELGETDEYSDENEKETIKRFFSGETEEELIFTTTDEYGFLGTAYTPVYDKSGKAVAMVGVDIDAEDMLEMLGAIFMINAITIGVVTGALMLIYYGNLEINFIKPIRTLNNATKQLVSNLGTDRAGEFKVNIHTNDELEELAESFSTMDREIKDYMDRFESVTKEKEHIRAELNIAARIQKDMLPSVFPPFPDRNEFSIYASMDPAREVGGDFYDFFLLDEDHIGLLIADVSDKGVPASLFMAIAKALLKNRADLGGTPAEVLADVNNQLCEGNDAGLFVTVWFGIVDLKTGKGIAANAGHEHPAFRHKDGSFELVIYKHGLPLASLPNLPFYDHEFKMEPGDTLFVYTDGAVEANNPEKEQFGTDRLIETLNTVKENDPQKMIEAVSKSIEEFVLDEPQFDDTTMLAFCYFGKQEETV